jgi:hypothetical protein
MPCSTTAAIDRAYVYDALGTKPKVVIDSDDTGVALGDVDDGTADFLITSARSGIHGYHSGRIFIISSGVRR